MPNISLYLPSISLYLPSMSLYLPTSPYISLCRTEGAQVAVADAAVEGGAARDELLRDMGRYREM